MKLSEKALSLGDSVTLQITSKANELKAKFEEAGATIELK